MKKFTYEEKFIDGYKNFLNSGKTERECVSVLVEEAEKKGYRDLRTVTQLKSGDKVYITKFNKAVALFTIGTEPLEKGMNILGAHIDSPRLDVKQRPFYERSFLVYLNTHYYGGIKKYQWVTLPLAIHGVVCKKDGTTVNVCIGEDESDPVFCISDILPHLAQKQMDGSARDFISGESLDLVLGSEIPPSKFEDEDKIYNPEKAEKSEKEEKEEKDEQAEKSENDKDNAKNAVLRILFEKYGVKESDLESAELEVVPAGRARDLGLDRSLVLAYGQDDRSCAYASAQALFDSPAQAKTCCCVCVDKEEIGSVGATGMASHFFENVVAELLERTGDYSDLKLRRCLENSAMLSSDVNAAYDPQNGDLYDSDNSSYLNGGLVFNKYTGSRGKSGANDASAEYIARIRNVLDQNQVCYQMSELGKVDAGGGGTIAYLASKYGMYVIDAGVAVLSMHAPWEITAKEDLWQAYNGYKAFLTL